MVEKKKVEIITIEEFKEIFELSDGYKISKSTLRQYTNYIKGSYLLYQEIVNIKNKKLSINFQGNKIKLQANFHRDGGFQNWINSLGSRPAIELSYWHNNYKEFEPFWAQGSMFKTYSPDKDDTSKVITLAYDFFTSNVLRRLDSKYSGKYGIHLLFRNIGLGNFMGSYYTATCMMTPIWIDGVKYMFDLVVENSTGTYEYISAYKISGSIDNRVDIWLQKMLPPVKRIIDSIK